MPVRRRGLAVLAAAAAISVTGGGAASAQTVADATTPSVVVTHGWVRASVATVWLHPGKTRPVDAPALRRHPHIARWIDHQSMRQRLDLTERVLTQALRGEPVDLLRTRARWTQVRVTRQRGSAFPLGIVGWVPTRQLTQHDPKTPVVRTLPRSRRHGRAVVHVARDYLGVRYLWGGTSPHGIDCSGLTYEVMLRLGRQLPRDAADQARVGRPVARGHLRRGDLVFFGPGGWRTIHHVGIYAGRGRVLHAPYTGARVRYSPLSSWSDYWGARRYLRR